MTNKIPAYDLKLLAYKLLAEIGAICSSIQVHQNITSLISGIIIVNLHP